MYWVYKIQTDSSQFGVTISQLTDIYYNLSIRYGKIYDLTLADNLTINFVKVFAV